MRHFSRATIYKATCCNPRHTKSTTCPLVHAPRRPLPPSSLSSCSSCSRCSSCCATEIKVLLFLGASGPSGATAVHACRDGVEGRPNGTARAPAMAVESAVFGSQIRWRRKLAPRDILSKQPWGSIHLLVKPCKTSGRNGREPLGREPLGETLNPKP